MSPPHANRFAGGARPVPLITLPRLALLLLPVVFVLVFVIGPLAITVAVSFWQRVGFTVQPALTPVNYVDFFEGVRIVVLERSLVVAPVATAIGLVIAYPIAYFLAFRASRHVVRVILLLITIPFLVNYVIRNFAWSYLLGRNGPINDAIIGLGSATAPSTGCCSATSRSMLGSSPPTCRSWSSRSGSRSRASTGARSRRAGCWARIRSSPSCA